MIHFDGVVFWDGVQGGSNSALAKKWLESAATFDSTIVNTITHRHWLQIKRCIKLCDNSKVIPKGQPGYDPTYKYRMIFDVIITM